MDNRRDFLKKAMAGAAFASVSGLPFTSLAGADDTIKLTILHTNDMHSRVEPFPMDGGKYQGLGGMARRAALVQKIRKEEKHVLLFDSGDIFQGTPYFNFFAGELEYKLMSQMAYDATIPGNHDFDNGLEGIEKQLPHAKFNFISSNYDFSKTILKNTFKPYQIFKKGDLKIGVFALGIELQGLVNEKHYRETVYLDPVSIAKEMVQELKNSDCDLIICLSHLGYKYREDKIDDMKLAAQVDGIDLILGGHTHTFLDKPTIVKSPDGNDVSIHQVGWCGIKLGRIDCNFQRKLKKKALKGIALNVS